MKQKITLQYTDRNFVDAHFADSTINNQIKLKYINFYIKCNEILDMEFTESIRNADMEQAKKIYSLFSKDEIKNKNWSILLNVAGCSGNLNMVKWVYSHIKKKGDYSCAIRCAATTTGNQDEVISVIRFLGTKTNKINTKDLNKSVMSFISHHINGDKFIKEIKKIKSKYQIQNK